MNVDGEFPSVEKKQKRKICKLVRNCLDGKKDVFINYFDTIQHVKQTRNNNYMLRFPKIKLESTKNSFYFYSVFIYNKLPKEIRSASDFKVFNTILNSFNFT